MHNNRKYCTHSLFFSKKTISHSKTIETNLSLSLRNEPLIPINSNTLLRTYRSRYLSLPLTHTRLYPSTHALVPSLLPSLLPTNIPTAAHLHTHSSLLLLCFLPNEPLHACAPSPTTRRRTATTDGLLRPNHPLSFAYRNLSESIRTNLKSADTLRLVQINSDKFRYPPTNIPRAPNHPFPLPHTPSPATSRTQHLTVAHLPTNSSLSELI